MSSPSLRPEALHRRRERNPSSKVILQGQLSVLLINIRLDTNTSPPAEETAAVALRRAKAASKAADNKQKKVRKQQKEVERAAHRNGENIGLTFQLRRHPLSQYSPMM